MEGRSSTGGITEVAVLTPQHRTEDLRFDVASTRLATAMIASFVAIEVAMITGAWYGMVGLDKIDWARFNGLLLIPEGSDLAQLTFGWFIVSVNGFIFGLIFVYLIRPVLPFPLTPWGNFAAGQLVGAVMSTLALLWWTPGNFPQFDPGFFSNNLGWKVHAGTYLWHAVFFFHLTSFYDPKPAHAPDRSDTSEQTRARS